MKIRLNSAGAVILLASICALGQTANIDQSAIVGGTYVNRFLGLTFTRPTTLSYERGQAVAHPLDRAFVLVKAVGKSQPGHVTSLMVLSADKLSYYPSPQRSAAAYMSRMEQDEKEDGYVVLQRKEEFLLGDCNLLRVDFRKGPLREAILVTTRRGFALVLIAISGIEQDLDSMLHSAQLSFND
jgi:hypothetical protein